MKKIFVLGDSISIHYGPFLERFLEGHLHYARKEGEAEALRDLDKMQGANGGDSGLVLSYLKQKQGQIDCDYLLLNCGLHDIRVYPDANCCAINEDAYAENLRAIVAIVAKMQSKLIWVTSTPFDESRHNARLGSFQRREKDLARYNQIATDVMTAASIPIIDLHGFTASLGEENPYQDHVHFTEAVRRLQAAYLAGWLIAWDNRSKG